VGVALGVAVGVALGGLGVRLGACVLLEGSVLLTSGIAADGVAVVVICGGAVPTVLQDARMLIRMAMAQSRWNDIMGFSR
jgi:hypothetical protein